MEYRSTLEENIHLIMTGSESMEDSVRAVADLINAFKLTEYARGKEAGYNLGYDNGYEEGRYDGYNEGISYERGMGK